MQNTTYNEKKIWKSDPKEMVDFQHGLKMVPFLINQIFKNFI